MLCPTTIAADAISDSHGLLPHELAHLHRELVDLLIAHGVLVFGDNGEREFLRNIKLLSIVAPTAAHAWDVKWQSLRKRQAPSGTLPLEELADLNALRINWRRLARTGLCTRPRARLLGVPATASSHIDPGSQIEITELPAFLSGSRFTRLRRMQHNQVVRSGTTRESIWRQRLRPLVEGAQQIVIFDKFVGKNAAKPSHPNDELAWLLRNIDATATRSTVEVVTACRLTPKGQFPLVADLAADLALLAQNTLGNGGIRSLKFRAAPAFASPRFPHDRHLRFDTSVIELSAGMDRLRGAVVPEAFTATYGWHVSHLRKARENERKVRTNPSVHTAEVWSA